MTAAVLLNARYLPMGIALAPSLRGSWLRRAAYGEAMVDASWAMANRGGGRFDPAFLVGATLPSYPAWLGGTAIGVVAGDLIGDPADLGLDALFREVKRTLDPAGVMNPGVKIADEPFTTHIDYTRLSKACATCGNCNSVCPVYDVFQSEDMSARATIAARALELARRAGPVADAFGKRNAVPGELLVRIKPTKVIAHAEGKELHFEPRKTEIVVLDDVAGTARAHVVLALAGSVSRLRHAGDDAIVFVQERASGHRQPWLMNLRNRVARPIAPLLQDLHHPPDRAQPALQHPQHPAHHDRRAGHDARVGEEGENNVKLEPDDLQHRRERRVVLPRNDGEDGKERRCCGGSAEEPGIFLHGRVKRNGEGHHGRREKGERIVGPDERESPELQASPDKIGRLKDETDIKKRSLPGAEKIERKSGEGKPHEGMS